MNGAQKSHPVTAEMMVAEKCRSSTGEVVIIKFLPLRHQNKLDRRRPAGGLSGPDVSPMAHRVFGFTCARSSGASP